MTGLSPKAEVHARWPHDSVDAMAEIVDAVSSGRISPREAQLTEISASLLEMRLLYLAASTLLLCHRNDMRNHIESPLQRPPGPGFPWRARDLRPGFAAVPMD